MEAGKTRNYMWVFALLGLSLPVATVRADESVIRADRYVFSPEQSTIVQTGGFAGVHWTYSVEGQFCLIVDPNAGTARFEQVDANAVDVIEPARTLDPNAVFNLTGLAGKVVDDAIEFTGQTADGSTVGLTVTFTDDTVRLTGGTTPPPNSADFFVFAIDAIATRRYAAGTGDPNTPYLIATAAQMNAIGTHPEDWNKHFQLTADIDLSAFDGKDGRPEFNIIAPHVNAEEWDFGDVSFSGVFDGGGHTIARFSWSSFGIRHVGLFGCLSGTDAEIRNVGVIDPNIEAYDGSYVGALVGYLRQGALRDCFVQGGAVFGVSYVGGLVGSTMSGTVARCHTDGDVNGGWYIGGLAGENRANIEQSCSASNVDGDRYVGGLVGFNRVRYAPRSSPPPATISDCHATGRVSGDECVGGLAGHMRGGSATRSYATGPVSGNHAVGGLVGLNIDEITGCYSAGDVTGDDCAGGLVGDNRREITNCYATGTVFGTKHIGGLAGYSGGSIRNCYAIGVVSVEPQAGGLVGFSSGGTIGALASFWDIETSGQKTSPTGTGLTTAQMQTAATYLDAGWDFVGETANGIEDLWWIDEGRDYPRLWWERDDEASLQNQTSSIKE